jgi:hypothetical protein
MGKQDKRASEAAKFFVACIKNDILLSAAMRATSPILHHISPAPEQAINSTGMQLDAPEIPKTISSCSR